MTKSIPLKLRDINASQLVLGCMRLGGGWDQTPITAEHIKEGHEALDAALEIGINMFDHADIYTKGKAEQVFGEVLKERPGLREQILIQSKCGIRFGDEVNPHRFDFSESHILNSVDGILERLGTEYIDFLLLHRPDPLVEPEEVASAIHKLKASGKVRYFGVSNMSQGQIRLLQAYSDEPFIVNQLEMSLKKIGFVETGVHVNQEAAKNNVFPEGTIEHCRLENIQLQSWGPLAQGVYSGRSLEEESETVVKTAALVQKLAEEKNTTPESIVLAWLMTHPAGIQPVIGTINAKRILACKDASTLRLTREEWYTLYISSRGVNMP
ncbi:aldo/keto reductase [Paenibacillus baekrokdamisoli]|uniref:Aldo/keto reductase n=1 Tax=Paenibacillus baekrokdamisoli TaxID=1712516 RepID=A0A3G9IT10_9BACL|nr:aldo/keto reductase [Paenibacillus baekrokdamisoli]MBB3072921.1 putative oxidoreductase [Paenibacillus baekrokdamisoli]BBH21997.1 aldo/keto reductase [Paenibacillus baekrokdamisoli]